MSDLSDFIRVVHDPTVKDLHDKINELQEKLASSNKDYAKCAKEIYDLFFYGSADQDYIEQVLKKHFA